MSWPGSLTVLGRQCILTPLLRVTFASRLANPMKQSPARWRASFTLLAVLLSLLAVGCSGRPKNVARRVTGKITLGGQPLANALVQFMPTAEKGSPSFGVTDETGTYTLVWSQKRGSKIEGAQIGDHVVRITTFVEPDPSAEPPITGSAEKVPYKYRVEGGYPKVTVNKGSNTIDIALDPGPVEPPQPKTKGRPGRRPVSPDCY